MGKPIFIKHFSEIDNAELEFNRTNIMSDAKNKGLQEREEKKAILIQEKIWSEDKENQIEQINKEISNLELVGKNLIIKRQILQNKEKIKKQKDLLFELVKEKDELFGFCLEDFVDKKMNELVIFNSFYKDRELKNKLFTAEEFDFVSELELRELVSLLNNFYIDFGSSQIKRICASPFFMATFTMAEDNAFNFFGKHIAYLTILQINMFSQGRYFKNLIQSHNEKISPPSDVLEDPDKLIEWYDNVSVSKSNQADGVGYVGASRGELEKMVGGKAVTVQEFAAKKNNAMSMHDFIEMHGI